MAFVRFKISLEPLKEEEVATVNPFNKTVI